jgi:hypothetical protein
MTTNAPPHDCRAGHDWDEPIRGVMFTPEPDPTPQTATCQRCGTVRTYDPVTGRVAYRYAS